MMSKHYVYWHRYPKDYPDQQLAGKVFYVGKGSRSRSKNHLAEARKGVQSEKCDIIRSIWAAGKQVVEEKIAYFDNEAEAYELEKKLINELGLSTLANMAGGGKGGARPGAGRPPEMLAPIDAMEKASALLRKAVKVLGSAPIPGIAVQCKAELVEAIGGLESGIAKRKASNQ